MTRIADLGEACDKGIKTLSKIMDGDVINSVDAQVQLNAAKEAIHAYFQYQSEGKSD